MSPLDVFLTSRSLKSKAFLPQRSLPDLHLPKVITQTKVTLFFIFLYTCDTWILAKTSERLLYLSKSLKRYLRSFYKKALQWILNLKKLFSGPNSAQTLLMHPPSSQQSV